VFKLLFCIKSKEYVKSFQDETPESVLLKLVVNCKGDVKSFPPLFTRVKFKFCVEFFSSRTHKLDTRDPVLKFKGFVLFKLEKNNFSKFGLLAVDANVAKLTFVLRSPLFAEKASITFPLNKYSPGK